MAAGRLLVLDAVRRAVGFHLQCFLLLRGRLVPTIGMPMSLERSWRCLYLLEVRFAARFAAMIGLDHSPRYLPRLRMHCAATPISEAMARGVQSQDDRMVRGFHISCPFVHCKRNTKHWLLGGSEWLVVYLRLLILVWAIRIPGTGESFRSGDRLGQEYRLACLRNTRIPLVHNISGGGMGEFHHFVVLYVGFQYHLAFLEGYLFQQPTPDHGRVHCLCQSWNQEQGH